MCYHTSTTIPTITSLQKEATQSVPNLCQNPPCFLLFLNQTFKKPTSEPEILNSQKIAIFIFAKLPIINAFPKKETKTSRLSFLKPMSPKSKSKTEPRAQNTHAKNKRKIMQADKKAVFVIYTKETLQYKPELIGHEEEYKQLLEKAAEDARAKGLEVVFVPFDYDDFMRFSDGKDSPDLRAQWAASKLQA